MIYLIKVRYEDVTLLKVGYAKSIKKRLEHYTTENPLFELLDYREGDRKLESLLHYLFREYKFEKGLEWFYYDDYIVNNFHSDFKESILIEKVKKKMDKSKSFSGKLRIYCKFKEKYPEIDFVVEGFQLYLDVLGFDRCRELGYKENLLYEELFNLDYFDNTKLADNDKKTLRSFLQEFYKYGDFRIRMKMYCKFSDEYKDNPFIMDELQNCIKDPRYLQYYRYYGTNGCANRNYQNSRLRMELEDISKGDELAKSIYSNFSVGDKMSLNEIKLRIKDIYTSLGINKSPKASDIKEFFSVSRANIKTKDGISNGFKLGEKLR